MPARRARLRDVHGDTLMTNRVRSDLYDQVRATAENRHMYLRDWIEQAFEEKLAREKLLRGTGGK